MSIALETDGVQFLQSAVIFPFHSVQKLSEFLSSEEIGEEQDKCSEPRNKDNHSKYQAVVSVNTGLHATFQCESLHVNHSNNFINWN